MSSLTMVPLMDPGLGAVAGDQTGVTALSRSQPSEQTGRRFGDSMERANLATGQVAPAAAQPPDLNAQDRVRRSLELDGAKPAESATKDGDAILDGLQKLRGTFDAGQARLMEVMNSPVVDARTLLSMQMEMVNFTMLVDVSSKLTGKSTQSFDSLMKGQ